MDFTATPETGPVDASAMDSVLAEYAADETPTPADALESVTQELVNEAEGKGDAEEAPTTEDDATNPAESEAQAEEGTPDEPVFTVKVNGEDIQVPQSELLKGYSRTEDYKAKTMAVADERRAIEAERQQLTAQLSAEYASKLENAANLMARFDPILANARTVDWEALKAQDPAAYVTMQDAVQERLSVLQQSQAEVERIRGEAQQQETAQAEQERATRFETAASKIVEAMPELADEAKFGEFAKEAVGFLRTEGFSQDEIADSLDHRVLMLANDAMQWRAHKAAREALPEKKVVQKSAVRPLTTDAGSRATPPRFPTGGSRDRKVDWAVQQLLSQD